MVCRLPTLYIRKLTNIRPEIDPTQQSKLLDLLVEYVCVYLSSLNLSNLHSYHVNLKLIPARLLEPIGSYRSDHTVPSKGKRSKKRKRDPVQPNQDASIVQQSKDTERPSPPQILNYITVGLNSTSRSLESIVKPIFQASADEDAQLRSQTRSRLAAIFLMAPASAFQYSHLPTIASFATHSQDGTASPLLVPLDTEAEEKLKTGLGLPRVGVVGIMADAPGAGPLLAYVREHVKPMDVPWIRETMEGKWKGTTIEVEMPQ